MFDIKEDVEVESARLAQMMEQLDVFISVKPKPKQPSKVSFDLSNLQMQCVSRVVSLCNT